jgi:hypothetical protein
MNFKIILSGLAVAAFVLPGVAGAVTILDTLNLVSTVIGLLVPIIISLALVVFFWGMVVYLAKMGDDTERKKGLQLMIWGVVAIFVMVSIWGIIGLLQSTFKVNRTDPIVPKAIQLGRTFQ